MEHLAAVFFGLEVLFEVISKGAESAGEFTEAWHADFAELPDPLLMAIKSAHEDLMVSEKLISGLHKGDAGRRGRRGLHERAPDYSGT
jgi:hypothetical protein